jgi:hypothetical protein
MAASAMASESVTFNNIPSQAGPGIATYNAGLAGGYVLASIDWEGFAVPINTATYGSELRCLITPPGLAGAEVQLGQGTTYPGGATFTGTTSVFGGFDPVGSWTFDFYESYDDGGDGQPDATWEYITFDFIEAIPCVWGEDFEGGIPGDWTLVDNTGNGGWGLSSDFDKGNESGGAGECAAIDSDYYGFVDIDAEMITHEFAVPSDAELHYQHYFRVYSGNEYGDVDITTDGGTTWTNLAQYTSTTGPELASLDLSGYAGENVKVRWHYYDANYDWYWHVDNVCLTPEPASLLLLALGAFALRRR